MQGRSAFLMGVRPISNCAIPGKPISGWGSLLTVIRYFERRGIQQVLASVLPDGSTSPNQIAVIDLVMAFLAAVLTGGERFAHIERLRTDEVVENIFLLTTNLLLTNE